MYAQHGAKLHLLAHFASYAFHTDGVAGSDTVLLSPGLDYGVHHSSRARDKPSLYGLRGRGVNQSIGYFSQLLEHTRKHAARQDDRSPMARGQPQVNSPRRNLA